MADDERAFECNICLETARDAVVSFCGHLFCWPCLHTWLESQSRSICPVCKAAVTRDKVIPLYGRGSSRRDPRDTELPPRPAGQRSEADTNQMPSFGFGDGGFHMSFGIGAFPFGFFASTLTTGGVDSGGDDALLSKVFLWVALLFIVWLFFA